MKKKLLLISFASLIFSLLLCNGLIAQNESGYGKKELIELESADVKTLKIINKHGDVSIFGWDKDTISIETLINVKAPGPNAADEVLNFISIKRARLGDQLLFRTQFDQDFFSNFPFSIDYIIHTPKHLNLDVTNSIGNIIINENNGQISVSQEYGHLHINHLGAAPEICHHLKMSFVEAILENIGYVEPHISNSTIEGSQIAALKGKSEYSLINLNHISTVELDGTTDRITIQKADSVTLRGNQLLAKVDSLGRFGYFTIENGHLELQVSKQLHRLSVANKQTRTTIIIPSELSYFLNGEVTNGHFTHPNSSELRFIKEEDKTSFSGIIGPVEQTRAEIVVFNNNSELIIQSY